MDERAKARERLRQHLERWCNERLQALGDELARNGIPARTNWGGMSWEPCLVVQVPWSPGEQTVWCRAVAVRVEQGKPVYRWRFVWGDHDVDGLQAITYPASDIVRAARMFANLIEEGREAVANRRR
ncbi:MAG: hypothetical protein GEV03_25920 [Streptosporangiales bacterium]|nr:hypothetical protein [Streptosporangiales bacterium]